MTSDRRCCIVGHPRLVPSVIPHPPLLPSSIPQARRAMSGISLDGSCLKISSIINPQPGAQGRHPGQGWTVAATISIAYLVFLLSLSVWPMGVCKTLTAQTAYPVTSLRQEMWVLWWVGAPLFSLIANNPAVLHVKPGPCSQGRPRPRAGQERSSVAEARECLGAQGPGQEVRRRRFAETQR